MTNYLPHDDRDVIRQVNGFYCTTSPNDFHSGLNDASPPRLTQELLRRRCSSVMAEHLVASDKRPKNTGLSPHLIENGQQLEDVLPPCHLMNLPAELREQIFALAVTEWVDRPDHFAQLGIPSRSSCSLRRAIRIDRLNKPAPPAITLVSRQARAETLQLYYELNVFECWRPFNYWNADWGYSTFIDWLGSLGEKMTWLRQIVLLYKHESELEAYNIDRALFENGFDLRAQIIHRRELSEYEMSYEAMGLPRHFGRQRRRH